MVACLTCICQEPDSFKFVELQHLRSLQVDETTWACACGGHQWSSLSVLVQQGQEYFLEVGKSEQWWDYQQESDCRGYDVKFIKLICCDDQWVDMEDFEPDRRAPEEKWNALICCIGRMSPKDGGNCAPITFNGTLTVHELHGFDEFNVPDIYCFANDVDHFHHDNDGAVNLTITRLA